MFKKFVASAATLLVAVSLSLIGVAGSAAALGAPGTSDGPIPYSLTPTALTLSSGHTFNSSSPTNDGNVKYIPLSQYSAGQSYTNQGPNWTVLNINFHIEQNAGFGAAMIGKTVLPFDTAASGGAFRGTLPSTGYCIVWVQVDGYNEHFGEGGQAPLCTTPPTVADAAAAAPTIVAATCATGQTLSLGTATNASWGAVTGGTGPGSYSVTATATSGHTFSDGSTTKNFTGTLTGPLPADAAACQTPPSCIPDSSVSYSYAPGTNSGDIVVTDIKNSTGDAVPPVLGDRDELAVHPERDLAPGARRGAEAAPDLDSGHLPLRRDRDLRAGRHLRLDRRSAGSDLGLERAEQSLQRALPARHGLQRTDADLRAAADRVQRGHARRPHGDRDHRVRRVRLGVGSCRHRRGHATPRPVRATRATTS